MSKFIIEGTGIMEENKLATKRICIFLGITLGFYFICWLIAVIQPGENGQTIYSFLKFPVIFMGTPVLAEFLTRKITKDKTPWHFGIKVWKNWKMLIFSAFVPTAAIFLGIIVFYLFFPNDLDFSGKYIIQQFSQYGIPSKLNLTIPSMLVMGIVVVLISAIFVPYWFLGLGEEIGWRGYLLPLLCKKMNTKLAVIVNGALWGIGHASLIYFGFNYGLNYTGAPYTGMLMMILMCTVLGVWMSYVTLKTDNCMYAAVIHGSVDVIGEAGVFVSLATQSSLLGPNPTGIISMSVLAIGAVILLARIKNKAFSNSGAAEK